jgi:hypothetical protein
MVGRTIKGGRKRNRGKATRKARGRKRRRGGSIGVSGILKRALPSYLLYQAVKMQQRKKSKKQRDRGSSRRKR